VPRFPFWSFAPQHTGQPLSRLRLVTMENQEGK
jgi:hypothetical protein